VELAEVLARRRAGGDLDRARRLASASLEEAQNLGMRPFVERASALLRELPHRRPRSEQLTPREVEVARLVAEGLTNREVATRLFLSVRTVDVHVDHILTKLGYRNRTQLVGWVYEQGLRPEDT
jgi:DNA-binding NarL/FixJ family response regulator